MRLAARWPNAFNQLTCVSFSCFLQIHVALPVTDVCGLYRDVRTTPHADHTAVTLTEAKPNGGQDASV